ncbi:B-cell antigen receptor complex-associated protein alpha chain isoform X2 [Hyperolius riggenbachi]
MQLVPTSITVTVGQDANIPCNYESNESVTITWIHKVNGSNCVTQCCWTDRRLESNTAPLEIISAMKNDSGIYICRVTEGGKNYSSCGTYLRVKDPPVYIFFPFSEASKNKIITVEGVFLLFCAILPGTFLLYKKRLENLSVSMKQAEGENLYEGLNLEDCSFYEDISRGLQATYEDVGTLRALDIQLEKP